MLTQKELLTETVELDGTSYTVTAFTVRRRTAFEAQLRRTGAESLRECTLIFCCSLANGQPAFDASTYRAVAEDSDEYQEQSKLKGVDKAALLDDLAMDLLVEDLASYPETQLEPLVMACYRVNGLLGNDSNPSLSSGSPLDWPGNFRSSTSTRSTSCRSASGSAGISTTWSSRSVIAARIS